MKIFFLILIFSFNFNFNTAEVEEISPAITNGVEAYAGQFPWHVSLVIKSLDGDRYCGGSIISKKYVLTLADCVKGSFETIELIFGSRDTTKPFLTMESKKAQLHWAFDDEQSVNFNVAIVELPKLLNFGRNIQALFLTSDAIPDDQEAFICGNGKPFYESSQMNILRWSKVKTISDIECKDIYGDDSISEQIVCAKGFDHPWQSICHGDGGSALFRMNDKGTFEQFGIINFFQQDGCGLGQPFASTKIADVKSWITAVTGVA